MKRFFIFIRKEAYHILRDKRTLLILLGLPVVLVVLFGFAITNEIERANIAIVDLAQDEVSRDLTDRLRASESFTLHRMLPESGQIEAVFRVAEVKMAVVFPEGLASDVRRGDAAQIQLIADASDPNTATTLINYASAIFRDYQQQELQPSAPPLEIVTHTRMLYNPQLESVYMFVPGVMTVILMLVSAMMTSIAITREKELGTMEVLLVSPLRPFLIILGKVVPYILLALIILGLILVLAFTVFQMPVEGNMALLWAESLLFIITSLSLGILISTRSDSQQVAMLISLMALMLPTILLSGFIFPIESMPVILQWISNAIPARWFIIIVKNIMLKGSGFGVIWQETLILIGMTVLFIGASVRNFKIRLE